MIITRARKTGSRRSFIPEKGDEPVYATYTTFATWRISDGIGVNDMIHVHIVLSRFLQSETMFKLLDTKVDSDFLHEA
jgi:hypothetical protein